MTPQNGQIVHRFSYVTTDEISETQVRQIVDIRLCAINTITAEKPDWLNAAKANTGLQSTTTITEQPTLWFQRCQFRS